MRRIRGAEGWTNGHRFLRCGHLLLVHEFKPEMWREEGGGPEGVATPPEQLEEGRQVAVHPKHLPCSLLLPSSSPSPSIPSPSPPPALSPSFPSSPSPAPHVAPAAVLCGGCGGRGEEGGGRREEGERERGQPALHSTAAPPCCWRRRRRQGRGAALPLSQLVVKVLSNFVSYYIDNLPVAYWLICHSS